MDEAIDLLIRDKEKHVVDRVLIRVYVVTGGDLFDPCLHIPEEVAPAFCPFPLCPCLQIFHVVVEGKLDIHVHLHAPRQKEGEVRPGPCALYGLLFQIIHIFHEAGQAEYVLRHPLTPLAS